MRNYIQHIGFFILLISFQSCLDIFNVNGGTITLTCEDFSEDIVLEASGNSGVDYIIDCLVDVDDIDIIINEGTTVEFTEGSGIIVRNDAKLSIVSLVDGEPIILRGQDSKKGFWKGIYLASDSGLDRITNAKISDAGSNSDTMFKGAITVKTKATINGTTIENCNGYGVYVEDYAILNSSLVDMEIKDCTSYPVSIPVREWDRFFQVSPPDAFKYSNIQIENCVPNKIEVREGSTDALKEFTGDIVGLSVPYEVKGDVIVNQSGRFSLFPGAEIEMHEDTRIFVNGSISVYGDAENPVIIKGLEDKPGYWGGIWSDTGSSARVIEYLHILNGGGHGYDRANLYFHSGKIHINNCRISKSASCGIKYNSNLATLYESDNVFADNSGGHICEN